MITSIITGTLTKLLSDFASVRRQKAEQEIEIKRIEVDHSQRLELNQQKYELGLKIEEEKTEQSKLNAIEQQIKSQENTIKEILQMDYKIYTQADKWILNLVALMKPFITYVFCISYFILIILHCLNHTSKDAINLLKEVGYFGIIDGVVGFWFGFYSMSSVKKFAK